MAGSPRWKVYSETDRYLASCKDLEDASTLVVSHGGGTVRDGHAKRLTVYEYGIDPEIDACGCDAATAAMKARGES